MVVKCAKVVVVTRQVVCHGCIIDAVPRFDQIIQRTDVIVVAVQTSERRIHNGFMFTYKIEHIETVFGAQKIVVAIEFTNEVVQPQTRYVVASSGNSVRVRSGNSVRSRKESQV